MQGIQVAPMGLEDSLLVWISTNSPLLRSLKNPSVKFVTNVHLRQMPNSREDIRFVTNRLLNH